MKPAPVRVSKRIGLQERVKELQVKLAESIPVTEAKKRLKRTRARLRAKVKRLEEQLAASKSEADSLRRARATTSQAGGLGPKS